MAHTFQPLSLENSPSTTFEKPQAKPYQQIEVQGKKSFKCLALGCEKIFKFKSDMEKHVLVHTKEKPIACPYPDCNKSFKRPEALKNHVEIWHIVNKMYLCPHAGCGYTIHKKESLYLHLGKHIYIKEKAEKSPDDGKIYLPWKKVDGWKKKFWDKHKADFAERRKNNLDLLPAPSETGLEDLRSDWDILSCLEEDDDSDRLSERFFEQLEAWKNKDFSRDSSDTLSLRSFRDESPSLIAGARDLLKSICQQMAQEREENKEKQLGLPQYELENNLKSPVSEATEADSGLATLIYQQKQD